MCKSGIEGSIVTHLKISLQPLCQTVLLPKKKQHIGVWIMNIRPRLFKQSCWLSSAPALGSLHLLVVLFMATQIKRDKYTLVTFYWTIWANAGSRFVCSHVVLFSLQLCDVLGNAVIPPWIWCSTNWADTQYCGQKENLDYSWSHVQSTYNSPSVSLFGMDSPECFDNIFAIGLVWNK